MKAIRRYKDAGEHGERLIKQGLNIDKRVINDKKVLPITTLLSSLPISPVIILPV